MNLETLLKLKIIRRASNLQTNHHNIQAQICSDMKKLNYANPLYTNFNGGIDPEFARSKVISVALKKRGTNMASRMAQRIVTVAEIKEVVPEAQTEYAEVVSETKKQDQAEVVGTEEADVAESVLPNMEDL